MTAAGKLYSDRRMWKAYGILAAGLAISLWLFFCVKEEAHRRFQKRFEAQLAIDRDVIVQGLVRYIHIFQGVNAMFQGSSSVSQQMWRDSLVSMAWTQVPGVLEIGYAEYVTNNGISVPIRFSMTKLTNSLHGVGYDMMRDVRLREAMTRTGEYGAISGTTRMRLLAADSLTQRFGHVVFSPCFRFEKPGLLETEQRTLLGYTFAVYDSDELWTVLFKRVQHSQIGYALEQTRATNELLAQGDQSLQQKLTLGTWGMKWTILAVARPSFIDPISRHSPHFVFIACLACTLLTFVLMASHVQGRIAVQAERDQKQEIAKKLQAGIAERTEDLSVENEQLRQSLSKELELGEMKTTFLSTVSHEFRTPLGIIVSSVGILERYFDRLAPAQRAEHLQTIQQSAERMIELMEGALLFSKAEAGLVDFAQKPVDLTELCGRIVAEVGSSTNNRCPIDVVCNGEFDGAQADERLLRTILINLLTNAVKYSPNGVPVHFQLCRKGKMVVFVIKDEGIGIPVADLPRLFTPFRRAQNVTNYSGSGLGLVLVKKCIEIHRGKLNLESKEGQGTTAIVELPLFASNDSA